jgi:ketosteroid isomerase-like protein
MKAILIQTIAIAMAVVTGSAAAQDKQPTEAEKTAHGLSDAYIASFNKGDAQALASMYAEDSQYTTSDGTVITGRETILKSLKEFFAKNKGAKIRGAGQFRAISHSRRAGGERCGYGR